ncbi:ABC transporter ATP-binding protein [Kocuria sp. cx-116]|uniref:ABC transporter ATP-binding protein n=1 Tax=Kocuria sp. cx-116 TaxID=2771378 RepID=UPI001685C51E|nr:ABC transporter ATP-binding protein [Kocuria sp. cx-116]MBD2761947.1 ABC transporter ATP-binding protein [Kocuria sp. cx-116]
MSKPLVEVSAVSKTASGRKILAPVSFSLTAGEGAVLTGPNGSGKTTLLKIMAGRELATEGSIRWRESLDPRAGIATVLGDPPYFENLTVLEHLRFVCVSWGDSPGTSAPERILEALGIARIRDSFPLELSSGERQLVALAIGLIRPSELMILDEPEQRLDSERRARVVELLLDKKRNGVAVVLATHDSQFVEALADSHVALEIMA